MTFLEALAKEGVIDPFELDNFVLTAKNDYQGDVFKMLYEKKIEQEKINQVAKSFYGIPVIEMKDETIPESVLSLIPEDIATSYRILPLSNIDGNILIGMVDPHDLSGRNVIRFMYQDSGNRYEIQFLPYSLFIDKIKQYSNVSTLAIDSMGSTPSGKSSDSPDDIEALEDLITKNVRDDVDNKPTDEKIIVSAPVVKTLAQILKKAIESKVSDIHIEPGENQTKIRYRLDGILAVVMTLPSDIHSGIVARIKVLSHLKLDEKRKPQDGRFPARIAGRVVDFRISIMPTFYGEKVVIRILDQSGGVTTLEESGMRGEHLTILRECMQLSNGIILITGPTGSGKSTTLYSILSELDKISQNVISLEDPVEYNIAGVSQSQVRPEIGYTFATGLRSILRQDPDVIMVGEIRDKETAQLAIQAALTGHLVFSTLHTNSAIGVIPRLVDMGVDPYLIAPTLRLAIAQRLQRRLTPNCAAIPVEGAIKALVDKQFETLPEEYKSKINFGPNVYEAVNSPEYPDGRKGRIAMFEMYKVDPELERLILKSPGENEVLDHVRKNGFLSLHEDGILKSMDKLVAFSDTNAL